jgi:peptidoglycan DL-endopeptidase CwlO
MDSSTRLTISMFTLAGLVLTGTAAAVFSGATSPSKHSTLPAGQSTAPAVNLGNCPTLEKPYRGGCVNRLQSELKSEGYPSLAVDGIFGEATRQAVIAFQQAHGLAPADGIVGPSTKAVLDKTGGNSR